MTKIPIRLKKDPIVDCVIEMRFESKSDSVADVLPGLLYSSFKELYPETQQTPEAQLPRVVRAQDKNLKARPVVIFKGKDGLIGIGDTGVQLTFGRPYPGWDTVEPRAQSVLGEVLNTDLLSTVERLSIRYNNIVTVKDDDSDLSPLELQFQLGRGLDRRGPGTAIRAEFTGDSTVTIVQIQGGANARITRPDQSPEEIRGVLLAVDTIFFGNLTDTNELKDRLKLIHDVEKNVFFNVITEDTTRQLEPVWEENHGC
jgi:uncharacterized protein (TIGR04255 family)